MKQIIVRLFSPISRNKKSHKMAWARVWQAAIEHHTGFPCELMHEAKPWSEYDRVYVYFNLEPYDRLSLFGGPQPQYAEFIKCAEGFTGEIVALDKPLARFGEFCKARCFNKHGEPNMKVPELWRGIDWDSIQAQFDKATCLSMASLPLEDVTLGDSHSISVWQPGYKAYRCDAQTLRGALKRGLSSFLPDKVRNLTIYFGNIDVRYHFGLQNNPVSDVLEKLDEYEKQLVELKESGQVTGEIELVHLLPIEDESRKIPTNNMLNGKSFNGSWAERNSWMNIFNNGLSEIAFKHGFKVHTWPNSWYVETYKDPKSFFTRLEAMKGLHLALPFYRYEGFKDSKTLELFDI
ncbi:hypothetical protein FDI46_gp085 [Aeromonas phage AS-gz]|uniref:Uncharacterized protein n=1 Tax=Aeromonas phage AS-gz TaxID=2026082 RepID=A0A223LFU7_9CAUD|nr:hypothetical protein FDI46_gp085 [Aeromonas phage AS-gz]ASU00621.1 hypothetical protein [Aeromonas phage AS-gz]